MMEKFFVRKFLPFARHFHMQVGIGCKAEKLLSAKTYSKKEEVRNVSSTKTCSLNNNVKIPVIGMDTLPPAGTEIKEVIRLAVEIGYRHFDCALYNGNEKEVGNGLKEQIIRRITKREDLFITSKLWNTFHGQNSVLPSLKESLANLRTTYLDMYLMHWPTGFKEGKVLFPHDENGSIIPSNVDYLETWKALEDCYEQGLVKSIGVCNFNNVQIDRLLKNCKVIPTVNQVESHPYLNQDKLLKFCSERKIQLTAYSPFGGHSRPGENEPNLIKDNVVLDIAKKYDKTPEQILLRYQMQKGLPVIVKPSGLKDMKQNFESQNFDLSPEDIEKLNGLNRNYRYNDMKE